MKKITINAGTFDFDFICVVGKDLNKVIKFLRKHFNDPQIDEKDFKCYGKVFSSDTRCPVMWMPQIPRTPHQYATLTHESLHLVRDCLEWADTPMTDATEEVWAHLQAKIIRDFLTKMK